jgi:L-threonylcarbamoyladenylate synthase
MTVNLFCDSDFELSSREIIEGKIVIYPTDTVYGLGTNPWSAKGVAACYKIKERDRGKKMPVLVNSLQTAKLFAKFGKRSEALAAAYWPGKLTIILPVVDQTLPQELIGRESTVAVRMPKHECCLRLVSACGGSLIGTSANISGQEALVDPFDPKLAELSKRADYFVSGACGEGSGLSSTIVDAVDDNSIKVTREGAIPGKSVLGLLGKN